MFKIIISHYYSYIVMIHRRHRHKIFFWPTIFILTVSIILVVLSILKFEEYIEQKSIRKRIITNISENSIYLNNLNNLINYKKIKIQGNFLHDKEMYLYTLPDEKTITNAASTRKYFLLTPFQTIDNRAIIVVRGLLDARFKNPKSRTKTVQQFKEPITITGITFPSSEQQHISNLFDARYNIWFDIHLKKMGEFINQKLKKSFLVLASQTPIVKYDSNILLKVSPENFFDTIYKKNHFTYFITYLVLAISIIFIYITYYIQEKRANAKLLMEEKN